MKQLNIHIHMPKDQDKEEDSKVEKKSPIVEKLKKRKIDALKEQVEMGHA